MPAKKIIVNLGIMSIPLKVEAATETAVRTHAACTGDGKHPVSRVKASVACPACGLEHTSVHGFPERCVELADGGLLLLDASTLEETRGVPRTGRAGTPANPDVGPVELKFHTRESVFGHTLPDDSVQNIYPDRAGEKAYALLVDALTAQPDLVGVMIWAPTTRNALWAVEVVDGRLVAGKRTWPEQVKEPATIAPTETSEADREMFAQIVALSASDFDMADYVDEATKGINDMVAAATPATPVSEVDMTNTLSDLLAKLEESGAKPIRARSKKKAKVAA